MVDSQGGAFFHGCQGWWPKASGPCPRASLLAMLPTVLGSHGSKREALGSCCPP